MDTRDPRDTGTRWSHHHFWAQLLPRTLPVSVDVIERYDANRAAHHERLRAALLRGMTAPTHCPNCGHHLVAATTDTDDANGADRADRSGTAPEPPPLLDPRLPPLVMTRVMEAIAGRRPVTQLAQVAAESVLRYVRTEADRARRDGGAPVLHTLHVQHLDDRAAELFGLLREGPRHLAPRHLAYTARIDLTPYGWRLTALRVLHDPTISTAAVTAAAAAGHGQVRG